jgi:hypothetical protein
LPLKQTATNVRKERDISQTLDLQIKTADRIRVLCTRVAVKFIGLMETKHWKNEKLLIREKTLKFIILNTIPDTVKKADFLMKLTINLNGLYTNDQLLLRFSVKF